MYDIRELRTIYNQNNCRVTIAEIRGYEGLYAVKYTRVDRNMLKLQKKHFMRESEAYKKISHPNLAKFIGCEIDERSEYQIRLITKYYEREDLSLYIKSRNNRKFEESEVREMMTDLIDVFYELQTQKISHRDIKPKNIFVDNDGTLKVGDFGTAIDTDIVSTISQRTIVGTPAYMSPEVKKSYSQRHLRVNHNVYKSDVFSLGVTILEMCALRCPRLYDGFKVEKRIIFAEIKQINHSDYIKHFLRLMLEVNEEDRPDFIDLHNEMRKLDEESSIRLGYSTNDMAPISQLCRSVNSGNRKFAYDALGQFLRKGKNPKFKIEVPQSNFFYFFNEFLDPKNLVANNFRQSLEILFAVKEHIGISFVHCTPLCVICSKPEVQLTLECCHKGYHYECLNDGINTQTYICCPDCGTELYSCNLCYNYFESKPTILEKYCNDCKLLNINLQNVCKARCPSCSSELPSEINAFGEKCNSCGFTYCVVCKEKEHKFSSCIDAFSSPHFMCYGESPENIQNVDEQNPQYYFSGSSRMCRVCLGEGTEPHPICRELLLLRK